VGDEVALEAASMVEVDVLQALAAGQPGGPDPAFTAVAVAGGHLALQAGDQELLMTRALGAGPFEEGVRSRPSPGDQVSAVVDSRRLSAIRDLPACPAMPERTQCRADAHAVPEPAAWEAEPGSTGRPQRPGPT
jgi:hypothetical protein